VTDTITTVTAAERYAALTALKAGLDDQIAQAKREALAEVADLRKASWTTPYGQVNMTRAEPRVDINAAEFLAFCQEHYPDEVIPVPTVRASFRQAFAAELTIVAGHVVHKGTGELVEFAHVTAEGDPTISYPASKAQVEAKEWARMVFADRAELLTASLREITS
jgi:hypothetical protein